jgi:hypothetical protein
MLLFTSFFDFDWKLQKKLDFDLKIKRVVISLMVKVDTSLKIDEMLELIIELFVVCVVVLELMKF